jgi:hypothetical protein
MKRAGTEQEIHRNLVRHLQARGVHGLCWFHVPNGGWRSKAEAAIFAGLGVKPGVPDLILLRRGQCYGLEIKRAGGKLTDLQTGMLAELRAAGALVAVGYGIDHCLAILEEWGLLEGITQ